MAVKMVYFPVAEEEGIPSGRIPAQLAEQALDVFNNWFDKELTIYQFSTLGINWSYLVKLLNTSNCEGCNGRGFWWFQNYSVPCSCGEPQHRWEEWK